MKKMQKMQKMQSIEKKEKKTGKGRVWMTFLLGLAFCNVSLAQLPVSDFIAEKTLLANLPAQLIQLEHEAQYLKQQLLAIKTLAQGQYQWGDVSQTINRLGDVIGQKNALAYGAMNVESQFKRQFPGYGANTDFSGQYQSNVDSTLATLSGVLQSLGQSAQDFTDEPRRMQFLQNQAENAQGQTQAIQAAAQISTETVSQLQLLRQTVMAQANAQTAYCASQIQTQASQQAGLKQMFENGNKQTVRYGESGHYVEIPHH